MSIAISTVASAQATAAAEASAAVAAPLASLVQLFIPETSIASEFGIQ